MIADVIMEASTTGITTRAEITTKVKNTFYFS